MKHFTDRVDEEMAAREAMATDETTEGGASGGGEVREVVSEPDALTPEEMAQRPKDVVGRQVEGDKSDVSTAAEVNKQVVAQMSALTKDDDREYKDAEHKAHVLLGDALRLARQCYEKVSMAMHNVDVAGIQDSSILSNAEDKLRQQLRATLSDFLGG